MPRDNHILPCFSVSLFSQRGAVRFLLFALVWATLTGFDGASWVMGFPAVLIAAWASLMLSPASGCSLSLAEACSFIPFFLRQSALSSIYVMRRTLSPRLLVNPYVHHAKKIRDDKGYWNQIESYIQEHSEAEFSHGMCPECTENLYGGQEWYKKNRDEIVGEKK